MHTSVPADTTATLANITLGGTSVQIVFEVPEVGSLAMTGVGR